MFIHMLTHGMRTPLSCGPSLSTKAYLNPSKKIPLPGILYYQQAFCVTQSFVTDSGHVAVELLTVLPLGLMLIFWVVRVAATT